MPEGDIHSTIKTAIFEWGKKLPHKFKPYYGDIDPTLRRGWRPDMVRKDSREQVKSMGRGMKPFINRLDIRRKIQESGNKLYESLAFCKPLQYLAGELISQNEEYVLNHYGAEETVGAQHILKKGFTDNQITFLKDLAKIIRTADLSRNIGERAGNATENP